MDFTKAILVYLPDDRYKEGYLEVHDLTHGYSVLGAACMGKSDNLAAAGAANPKRDPTQRLGDTPLGTYITTFRSYWQPAEQSDRRAYGTHKIDLNPAQSSNEAKDSMLKALLAAVDSSHPLKDSQAAQAERNDREGLLIHGGDLRSGKLRPTKGCIRVNNEVLACIVSLIGTTPTICIVLNSKEDLAAIRLVLRNTVATYATK